MSRLEDVMRALEEALVSMGQDKSSSREVLNKVFQVNNEIGKAARVNPSSKPALVELQSRVNLVTVEVKRGRAAEALVAFSQAEDLLRSV